MKALVTAEFDAGVLSELSKIMEVRTAGWGTTKNMLSPGELADELDNAQVLIAELEEVTAEVMDAAPQLAFVGTCRNTPRNVDIEAATERGIVVTNAPGRNANAVAELTMCLITMISRKVGQALRDVVEGKWVVERTGGSEYSYVKYKGSELLGKTLGIIGFGGIGRRLSRLASPYEMQQLVHDPFVPSTVIRQHGASPVDLETLLVQSDYVSVHVPGTVETRGFIDAAAFELMKPEAYLINTARGGVVDEAALCAALETNQIAGAALDVFAAEPLPLDHDLLKLENVVLLPHIAGATWEVIRTHSRMVYEDVVRFVEGRRPLYLCNPEAYSSGVDRR